MKHLYNFGFLLECNIEFHDSENFKLFVVKFWKLKHENALNLLPFLSKKPPLGENSPQKKILVLINIQNRDGCSFFYIHIFDSQILQIILWMIAISTT